MFAPKVFAQVSPPTGMPALPSRHHSGTSHLGLLLQTQLLTLNPKCKPGSAHPGPTPLWLWAVRVPTQPRCGSCHIPSHPPQSLSRVQQTMGLPVSDSTSSTKLSPCRWEVVFLNPEKAAGCRGHLPSPWDNRGGVSWAEGCPGWPASPGLASNIFTCGKNSLERNTMPRLTGSFV